MQTHGTPVYAGEAAGYIFNFLHDYTLYHSGDTALMSDMKMRQLNNLKWNSSQNNLSSSKMRNWGFCTYLF
jgi:hypothetical protein